MNYGTSLTPHQATHPGLIIKDELAERKIKQTELAAETGIQPTQLNEIIKTKRPLSAEQAILIGAALRIPAKELTDAQANYDLHCALIESSTIERLAAVEDLQMIKEVVDINYFRKEGIVTGRPAADVLGLLRVHNCKSVSQLTEHLLKDMPEGALYKKSEKLSEYKPFVNSWVRYVKHLAAAEQVSTFDFNCQEELLAEVKKVFQNTDVRNKLGKTLKKYGIKLVIKHKPDKTPLDGAAFWQDDNPILGLTERHSRYDNFIFTVYHELGHIFLHLKDKKNRSTDYVDSLDAVNTKGLSEKEIEANTYARNIMIPAEKWAGFVSNTKVFSDDEIERFAKSVGTPPSTVLGRLCFDEHMSYACNSIHKKNNIIP
jgi:HTH-type transcriptional regulator/antitoxin HigA